MHNKQPAYMVDRVKETTGRPHTRISILGVVLPF